MIKKDQLINERCVKIIAHQYGLVRDIKILFIISLWCLYVHISLPVKNDPSLQDISAFSCGIQYNGPLVLY